MAWDTEDVSHAFRRFFEIAPYILGLAMGVLLVLRGGYGIRDLILDGSNNKYLYFAHTIAVVGGLGCIVLTRYSLVRLIGVYAISAGISRIIIRFVDVVTGVDLMMFLLSAAMFVVSANLVIKGVSFVRGNVVQRRNLIIASSLLAAGNLLIVLVLYDAGGLFDIPGTEEEMWQYFINFLTYVVLLIMLDTETIRYNSPSGRNARQLDRIRSMYSFEPYASIEPEAAYALLNRSGRMWRTVDDSVVESEMTFTITESALKAKAVAQIWKGEDPIYITVSYEGGSVILANRMRADIVTMSGNRLRIVGKDGSRIEFLIRREVIG